MMRKDNRICNGVNKIVFVISVVLFCFSITVSYAGTLEEDYLIRFELPFGIGSYQTSVIRGSTVHALFSIESFVHEQAEVEAVIVFPKYIKPVAPSDIISELHPCARGWSEDGHLTTEFILRTENDIWYRLVKLYISPDAPEGRYEITCRLNCAGRQYLRTIPCWIASENYLEENVHLCRFSVPADKEGNRDLRRKENTFVTKDTSSRLLRSFNLDQQGHDTELIAVELENGGEFPVTLFLDYVIYDKDTGKPVDWLANLRDEQGFDMPGIYTQAFLGPREKRVTMFKIASQQVDMMPGEYLQKLSIGLFSAKEPFIEEERPLQIEKLNVTITCSIIMAIVVSLLGVIGMIVFRKFLFKGLTSREYILIGLYAAVAFSLVSIPTTVIYNIFHALLGPFSFVVTGIFSEIIFYLLLISLVVLLPRPGVVLCFIFAKFLLGAVILGKITALSVLWFPMRAVILEIALFISGLYEKDFLPMDISGYRKELSIPVTKMLWVAFVFGVADAFLAFISLNITMFFYRLFYAAWYIVGYVFISGFLYTFIVVPMGIRLGQRLKKVTVD